MKARISVTPKISKVFTWSGNPSAGQTHNGLDFQLQHINHTKSNAKSFVMPFTSSHNYVSGRERVGKQRPRQQPSTIPHGVFLPRIRFPFTWYSLSLPTTAKGMVSCWMETFQHGSAYQRQPHKIYEGKQITKHAPVPWHSLRGRELGKEEEGKIKMWGRKKKWEHPLLWSYRCRSCPPCLRQILSGGKTQCRSSPAPSSPAAQTKVRRWETRNSQSFCKDRDREVIVKLSAPKWLPCIIKWRDPSHAGALTRCLNSCLSSIVIVSAFAMIGMILTEWLRRFMNSMSSWRSLRATDQTRQRGRSRHQIKSGPYGSSDGTMWVQSE